MILMILLLQANFNLDKILNAKKIMTDDDKCVQLSINKVNKKKSAFELKNEFFKFTCYLQRYSEFFTSQSSTGLLYILCHIFSCLFFLKGNKNYYLPKEHYNEIFDLLLTILVQDYGSSE